MTDPGSSTDAKFFRLNKEWIAVPPLLVARVPLGQAGDGPRDNTLESSLGIWRQKLILNA